MARSPLFDIYDPYGALAEQAQFGMLPTDGEDFDPIGIVPLNRKPVISDLMPEEEKTGMLRNLAEMGSSGLSAIGWLLDTPGAIVRGGLSGGLGKAASALWETSDDRVTGRELARQYRLIGDRDTWGNFGAGLAAEILLDPLTYANPLAILGRGAYTPAGKALRDSGRLRNAAVDAYRGFEPTLQQAARGAAQREAGGGVRSYLRGQTPRQVLGEAPDYQEALTAWQRNAAKYGADPNDLDQPLARLMDVRIPGTNIGFSTDVFGEAVGDAVAGGLDRFGEWTKRAPGIGPVTRGAAMLFDSNAGFVMDPDRQWSARIAKADAEQLTANRMRVRTAQQRAALEAQVPDAAVINGVTTPIPQQLRRFDSARIQQALGDFAESQPNLGPNFIGPQLPRTSGDAVADWVLENTPAFREIRDSFVDLGPGARQAAESIGLAGPNYRSREGTGWIPRQMRWWERPAPPVRPNVDPRQQRPWSRGSRVLNTVDNFGRTRQDYLDLTGGQRTIRSLTGSVDPRLDSAQLQQALQAATPAESRRLIDQSFRSIGQDTPYRRIAYDVMASPAYQSAGAAQRREMLREAVGRIRENKEDLAEFLRSMDTNFARTGTGAFDTPTWTNVLRYEAGQDRVLANTEQVLQELLRGANATPTTAVRGGGVLTLAQAAERLGFDTENFRRVWQQRAGRDVTNFSVDERLVDSLRSLATPSRASQAERGILSGIDNFTNAFKVGALASPAFHVRNAYSGALNASTQGAFNLWDMIASARASGGNYAPLARRLRNAPGYENLTDAERINRYLAEQGAQRIGSGTLLDDVSGLPEQEMRGLYPGANTGPTLGETLYNPQRSWGDWLDQFASLRGVGITRNARSRNTNPLLAINDAIGGTVEDALRGGTFLNQIRKGVDPGRAGDVSRLTQVDYSAAAFTPFERNFMKRVLPFYSFQKGILPSVADNLLYQPGGLMGKSVRAINRGSQPSEDNFVPEYLRQSAAIPLPADLPGIFGGSSKEGLQRYLTNIDLPWESTLQLFTPGLGATTASTIADTIQKTGSNLLGMTSPLVKAPIEYVTNRQLYSGRDLSDLFSVLERDLGEVGRPLEQAVVNFLPFGSRGLGIYRQLTDDRLDPADRYTKAAWNILAGAKLTDVDQERTKRLAARQVLNNLLETTPGVRTYENVTVPDDVLRAMPQEQQRLYLLYKIIQSEAAKRAREKKKQAAALDPLQMLGVINQF